MAAGRVIYRALLRYCRQPLLKINPLTIVNVDKYDVMLKPVNMKLSVPNRNMFYVCQLKNFDITSNIDNILNIVKYFSRMDVSVIGIGEKEKLGLFLLNVLNENKSDVAEMDKLRTQKENDLLKLLPQNIDAAMSKKEYILKNIHLLNWYKYGEIIEHIEEGYCGIVTDWSVEETEGEDGVKCAEQMVNITVHHKSLSELTLPSSKIKRVAYPARHRLDWIDVFGEFPYSAHLNRFIPTEFMICTYPYDVLNIKPIASNSFSDVIIEVPTPCDVPLKLTLPAITPELTINACLHVLNTTNEIFHKMDINMEEIMNSVDLEFPTDPEYALAIKDHIKTIYYEIIHNIKNLIQLTKPHELINTTTNELITEVILDSVTNKPIVFVERDILFGLNDNYRNMLMEVGKQYCMDNPGLSPCTPKQGVLYLNQQQKLFKHVCALFELIDHSFTQIHLIVDRRFQNHDRMMGYEYLLLHNKIPNIAYKYEIGQIVSFDQYPDIRGIVSAREVMYNNLQIRLGKSHDENSINYRIVLDSSFKDDTRVSNMLLEEIIYKLSDNDVKDKQYFVKESLLRVADNLNPIITEDKLSLRFITYDVLSQRYIPRPIVNYVYETTIGGTSSTNTIATTATTPNSVTSKAHEYADKILLSLVPMVMHCSYYSTHPNVTFPPEGNNYITSNMIYLQDQLSILLRSTEHNIEALKIMQFLGFK